MLSKLKNGLRLTDIKVKNAMHRFLHEEKGAAEVVTMVLIIIVVIGLVVIFRDNLSTLINNWFDKIKNQSNNI